MWPMSEGASFSWAREIMADAVHLTAYAVLAYVLVNFFIVCGNTKDPFVRTFALALIYGIFIEIMQSAIPGRSSSLSDVGVNTLGVVLMIVAIKKEILRVPHLRSGAVSL